MNSFGKIDRTSSLPFHAVSSRLSCSLRRPRFSAPRDELEQGAPQPAKAELGRRGVGGGGARPASVGGGGARAGWSSGDAGQSSGRAELGAARAEARPARAEPGGGARVGWSSADARQSSGLAEFGAAQAEARLVRTESGGAGGASRRARSSATRADLGRGQSSAAQRIGLRRTDLGCSATNPAAGARGARRRAECGRGARSSAADRARPSPRWRRAAGGAWSRRRRQAGASREGRGEQGGEEEDQCMTCGSHQTEANGTRSLLMLILPTKQKMEPLRPSNQT